jgi:hypothetical protein
MDYFAEGGNKLQEKEDENLRMIAANVFAVSFIQ